MQRYFFQRLLRYTIVNDNVDSLLTILSEVVSPTGTNAIHCDLPTLAEFQDNAISKFPPTNFIYTEKFFMDVIREDVQWDIVAMEHNRAHRSVSENFAQIIDEYYFPGIRKKLISAFDNSKICMENKYQEKQILHIDILITNISII